MDEQQTPQVAELGLPPTIRIDPLGLRDRLTRKRYETCEGGSLGGVMEPAATEDRVARQLRRSPEGCGGGAVPPAALHLLPGLLERSGGRLVDADGSRCEMPGPRVSDEHLREPPVRGSLRGRDSRVVDGGPCERMPEDDPVLDDAQETAVLGRRKALRGQGVGYRG